MLAFGYTKVQTANYTNDYIIAIPMNGYAIGSMYSGSVVKTKI